MILSRAQQASRPPNARPLPLPSREKASSSPCKWAEKDKDIGSLCCGLPRSPGFRAEAEGVRSRPPWSSSNRRDRRAVGSGGAAPRRGLSRRARRGSSGGRRRHGGSRREAEAESEVWRRQKDGREAMGVSLTAC